MTVALTLYEKKSAGQSANYLFLEHEKTDTTGQTTLNLKKDRNLLREIKSQHLLSWGKRCVMPHKPVK